MTRSRQRYLSMDGAAVRENRLPMGALASVLGSWERALRAALPSMVTHAGTGDAELARSLPRVVPMAGPSEPGSYRQSYGLEVAPASDEPELFEVSVETLDELLGSFERGLAELQHGRVIAWMTPEVAKPLLEGVSGLTHHGIHLKLEATHATLDGSAVATLRDFIKRDAEGRKAETQVLGVISSVNMKHSYLSLDSTSQGPLRVSFPNEQGEALCDAMAKRERVELTVSATLSSGGTLENANLRSLRRLGKRPSYRDTFRALWGSRRAMYAGVAHDERGVPDPDPAIGEGDE